MDTRIVLVYCLSDDLLKWQQHRDDPQCQLTDAEVMTIAIVAALYFGGNHTLARLFLHEQGYIPHALSRSRLCRRLQRLRHHFLALFYVLGEVWKELSDESIYVIDTLPVVVCDNYRIRHCRLYQGEAYRGCQASKKRYFYGLKLHLMVTQEGQPVEFLLTPGACSDTSGLAYFDFDLPAAAWIIGDKAYNDYTWEDILHDAGLHLLPLRKRNSQRPLAAWLRYLQAYHRKRVETAGSQIECLLPKHIHAVTAAGFELKTILFVLAASINCIACS